MSNVSEKKHEHKGRSSREMLDQENLKRYRPQKRDQFLDAGCGDGYSQKQPQSCGREGGFMPLTLMAMHRTAAKRDS